MARVGVCTTQLTATDQLQNYLINVIPSGVPNTDAVPGVLMVGDSTITIGPSEKACGLFYAANGITVQSAKLVGVVYAAGETSRRTSVITVISRILPTHFPTRRAGT